MALHHGWRSFWWWNTALLFFTCIVNALFFPETRYTREHPEEVHISAPDQEAEKQNSDIAPTTSNQDNVPDDAAVPITPAPTVQSSWLSRGKPSKAQFIPWGKYQGNILRELWLPWYLHIYPIVEFAAFVVSFSASGFLLANLTQQQVFGAPPYNFSPQSVGFTNFAILGGSMIGLLTSGWLSDWVSDVLTRRNNGVREPEMRLVAMVPYVAIMVLGCIIVAVGYEFKWPWEAVVIVGYACLGMQVTSLPSIASTYAIDSYKPITGSLFVTITM